MAGTDTKKRIHNAAKQLFAEKGYCDTKVSDITKAAESNSGSFYHHYKDKGALGNEIFREIVSDYDKAIQAACGNCDDLVLNATGAIVFFHAFSEDERLRCFVSEICRTYDYSDTQNAYDIIYRKYTKKAPELKKLLLIKPVSEAIFNRLIICYATQMLLYSYDEIATMYIETMFGMYGIPCATISKTLHEAFKIHDRLKFSFENFGIKVESTDP